MHSRCLAMFHIPEYLRCNSESMLGRRVWSNLNINRHAIRAERVRHAECNKEYRASTLRRFQINNNVDTGAIQLNTVIFQV